MEIYMAFKEAVTQRIIYEASIGTGIIIHETEDDNGAPVDVGKWELRGESTKNFPLGLMPVDIQYSKDGIIQMTETFFLFFEQGISNRVN